MTLRVKAGIGIHFEEARERPIFILIHRPGISHYTSFYKLAMTCVFVKQSTYPILCELYVYKASPYPEVTETFCRVPLQTFTQRLSLLDLTTSVGY